MQAITIHIIYMKESPVSKKAFHTTCYPVKLTECDRIYTNGEEKCWEKFQELLLTGQKYKKQPTNCPKEKTSVLKEAF